MQRDVISNQKETLLGLLRQEPGLDIFTIAVKMNIEPWQAQRLVNDLLESNMLVSGLQKRESSTIFERYYFCHLSAASASSA